MPVRGVAPRLEGILLPIKTADEIELLKQSAAVSEAALFDLAEAIRPGVSEHVLLGVFYHKMLSLGSEHCFSQLVSTGH